MSKLFKKTLIIMIFLFGAIASCISLFAGWLLYNKLTDEYKSKAIAITTNIARTSSDTFLNRDAATIQSIIDQCDEIKGISYVLVAYEDGEIVSHTFAPKVPDQILQLVMAPQRKKDEVVATNVEIPDRGDFLDICSPILSGVAGYLHVGMNLAPIRSYIWSAVIKLQMITFGIFLVTVGVAYFWMNAISRPLIELTEYANRVAVRDFSAEITIGSRDEVGMLARTMSNMAGEIEDSIAGLERAVQDATQELQDTLNYLSTIIQNLADGLVVLDSEGTITRYNSALGDLFNLKDDATGTHVRDLFGDEVAAFLKKEQQAASLTSADGLESLDRKDRKGRSRWVRQTRDTPAQFSVRTEDGARFPIELSVSVVQLKGVWNTIGIVRDITDRQRAEEALRASREDLEQRVRERTTELSQANELLKQEIAERLRTEEELKKAEENYRGIFENAVDGLFRTTPEGRYLNANPAQANILGYDSPEDLINEVNDIASQIYVHPEARETFLNLLKEHNEVPRFETQFFKKDGSTTWVSVRVRPVYDEDGELIFVEGITQDITERKRTEQEVLKIEKLESIRILAGGIAHDFNNLLTAILGNVSIVRTDLDPSGKNFGRLHEAERACLRAQNLTQQLLAFSKGGAPVKKAVNVSKMLKDSTELPSRGSNVRCEFSIPENIRHVEADPGQIAQVIGNLVINAKQAMPDGGTIRISARNVEVGKQEGLALQDGPYVKITVADDGCGIPSEHLPKIFDLYFTTKPKGSGLGLAASWVIVNNHGGTMSAESSPGEGATFHLYLPASEKKVVTRRAESRGEPISGSGRILLMDDDQAIRVLAVEVLEMLGYSAQVASDGEECIELFHRAVDSARPFDAVILDLTVPGGMGGRVAVERLKQIDPGVKAIVSSGYSDDPVMANYAEYGFSGIIPKPYDVVEVGAVLARVLYGDKASR